MNFSLPRRLPDLNGDAIPELVSSCAVTLPSEINDVHHRHVRTNFVLVSGGSGDVIGNPYFVKECVDLGPVNITRQLALDFDCDTTEGRKKYLSV